MEEGTFNPSRLTLARERNGLTKQGLADLCRVSRRTVTAWELGEVDSPPLETIADVLGFPVSFFWADDPERVASEGISFRAMSAMTARQQARVLAASSLALELSGWIDGRYSTPPLDLPDLSEEQDNGEPFTWPGKKPRPTENMIPAVAAETLRSVWKLGHGPVRGLLSFLERKGVRVFSLPVEDREVDAFSFWREDRAFVFLNTGKSAERIRFDLAHELGHLLIHRGINTQLSRAYEQQAQDFAATFLVPADALYAQVVGSPTLQDVLALKRHWKISAVAMVHRLWALSIISEWHYRTWMVELSQRGYRRGEPEGMRPERSRLLNDLLKIAREDGWPNRRIAAELRIPEDELNGMIFGLALANAPSRALGAPSKEQ